MPEASDLLSSSFPISVREMNDMGPLHEHEEYRGEPQELEKTVEVVKDRIHKSTCSFPHAEIDGTDNSVEDDYGFFSMDDDDYFQDGEAQDQHNALVEDTVSTSNSDTSSYEIGSLCGSSCGSSNTRKKSALKHTHDGIPLDFERKKCNRVLPKPDLTQRESIASSHTSKGMIRSGSRLGLGCGSRGIFRVSSEPVFVRPVYQSDDMDDAMTNEVDQPEKSVSSSGFVEGAMKKRISFGTINIREHTQTIGDNPSCSDGIPIQLDWDHEDLDELKLEEYETHKCRSRRRDEFHLNKFQRGNLLKLNGYSTNEINNSKREVSKVRNQRKHTKFLAMIPNLVTVEDAIESGLRKVKRSISKSKLNRKDDTEKIPEVLIKDDLSLCTPSPSKSLCLDMMDNTI